MAGSKVSREVTPRAMSSTQMSGADWGSLRSITILFSSGESRKSLYSPGGPAIPI